jgi:hypothetical protein
MFLKVGKLVRAYRKKQNYALRSGSSPVFQHMINIDMSELADENKSIIGCGDHVLNAKLTNFLVKKSNTNLHPETWWSHQPILSSPHPHLLYGSHLLAGRLMTAWMMFFQNVNPESPSARRSFLKICTARHTKILHSDLIQMHLFLEPIISTLMYIMMVLLLLEDYWI